MSSDYLIVNKKILPDYLEKVIYARTLLETQEVQTITEAVQLAKISRNTYYKYKDFVFPANEIGSSRKAVFSFILKDENGVLSTLINELAKFKASILTISQALPISGKANVLLSLDITDLTCSTEELIQSLKELKGVRHVHLDAIE